MTIKAIDVENIDEFWSLISPIGDLANSMASPIFRGQGNANWLLSPSSFRKDVVSRYKGGKSLIAPTDHIFFFEWSILIDFLHYCDQMGLRIPNDSVDFRKEISFESFTSRFCQNGIEWPTEEFYSFLGLAQHHGIPTRLLDWTHSAIAAAYFAAAQYIGLGDERKSSERIAVWIIDRSKLALLKGRLEYVSVAGSTSRNLAAQKGCFLLYRPALGMNRDSKFSFDEMLDVIDKAFEESESFVSYKITLSSNFVPDLLDRCNKFGVSAATMFPGYDGAAQAVLEFNIRKQIKGLL